MTKIKICGLKFEYEAEYLNKFNIDFAGFVLFFPKSKRNISVEKAKKIKARLNKSIKSVAVTVSPTFEQALEIQNADFDFIQIHGNINTDIINSLSIPIFRAFNVNNINEYEKIKSNDRIAGYVFDAPIPGSGKAFDWSIIKNFPKDNKMMFLAGGLSSENVSDAINYIHPYGVDVSSGVENEKGKDENKIAEFVRNVI